jgi:very-short-patch-repair endonuclease
VRRGVYAVGHTVLSATAQRLAAVLAIGDLALASHVTAAALWEIRQSTTTTHHVTTEGDQRSRERLIVHHAPIHPDDRSTHNGVPVTSLARTLVDLGDVVPAVQVRNAFVRAEQLRLIDMTSIDAALARASARRRGPRILRELLRGYDPRWERTRSDLELAMLDLLAARGLPEPDVNAWIDDRFMVDFLWLDHGLIIETDGAATHATASARRADARRDHALTGLGYRVLRIPSSELPGSGDAVAAALRRPARESARPARPRTRAAPARPDRPSAPRRRG